MSEEEFKDQAVWEQAAKMKAYRGRLLVPLGMLVVPFILTTLYFGALFPIFEETNPDGIDPSNVLLGITTSAVALIAIGISLSGLIIARLYDKYPSTGIDKFITKYDIYTPVFVLISANILTIYLSTSKSIETDIEITLFGMSLFIFVLGLELFLYMYMKIFRATNIFKIIVDLSGQIKNDIKIIELIWWDENKIDKIITRMGERLSFLGEITARGVHRTEIEAGKYGLDTLSELTKAVIELEMMIYYEDKTSSAYKNLGKVLVLIRAKFIEIHNVSLKRSRRVTIHASKTYHDIIETIMKTSPNDDIMDLFIKTPRNDTDTDEFLIRDILENDTNHFITNLIKHSTKIYENFISDKDYILKDDHRSRYVREFIEDDMYKNVELIINNNDFDAFIHYLESVRGLYMEHGLENTIQSIEEHLKLVVKLVDTDVDLDNILFRLNFTCLKNFKEIQLLNIDINGLLSDISTKLAGSNTEEFEKSHKIIIRLLKQFWVINPLDDVFFRLGTDLLYKHNAYEFLNRFWDLQSSEYFHQPIMSPVFLIKYSIIRAIDRSNDPLDSHTSKYFEYCILLLLKFGKNSKFFDAIFDELEQGSEFYSELLTGDVFRELENALDDIAKTNKFKDILLFDNLDSKFGYVNDGLSELETKLG